MSRMIAKLLRRARRRIFRRIEHQLEINAILLGKLHIHRIKGLKQVDRLADVEFSVFSQGGEDGIIQYLLSRIQVPIESRIFVEFGVGSYQEANTRFLLINDNWRGLVIDGSHDHINHILKDDICWQHDLQAKCEFVARDNIDAIVQSAGIKGDIGLLSIDIDGNDYWVWESIKSISPRIVICEYNSVFGPTHAISVPYNEKFRRRNAHYSNLYFGVSLSALCDLAEQKGYDFVGSNAAGVNAFFVRKDLSHGFRKMSASEGYVLSHIRESRDIRGNLTYVSGPDRLNAIGDLHVVDIRTGRLVKLRDIVSESELVI